MTITTRGQKKKQLSVIKHAKGTTPTGEQLVGEYFMRVNEMNSLISKYSKKLDKKEKIFQEKMVQFHERIRQVRDEMGIGELHQEITELNAKIKNCENKKRCQSCSLAIQSHSQNHSVSYSLQANSIRCHCCEKLWPNR